MTFTDCTLVASAEDEQQHMHLPVTFVLRWSVDIFGTTARNNFVICVAFGIETENYK